MFTGNGRHRNRPASDLVPDDGALPTGLYYIVPRPSGGRLGPLRDAVLGRDEWFALFRSDGTVDDYTFISGVRRGQFRLHPLGPRRMSTGCVVLQREAEFARLRECLLAAPLTPVGRGVSAYGTLEVVYFSDQRLPASARPAPMA